MGHGPQCKVLITLVVALLVVAATSCGLLNPLFAGGPYYGKVIDAETKAPLVGAVVLAVWYRIFPALVHQAYDFLEAEEVLTDSNGAFVVGQHAPMTWVPLAWVDGPHLTIFYPKYGYFPRYYVAPPMPLSGMPALVKMMERPGVVFELPPLKTREEQFFVLEEVVPTGLVPKEKMPNLVRLVKREWDTVGFPTLEERKRMQEIIPKGGRR